MDNEILTFTVEEAAKRLGIGRNAAYNAIKANQLPHIIIGHRILVPRVQLEKLLIGETEIIQKAETPADSSGPAKKKPEIEDMSGHNDGP